MNVAMQQEHWFPLLFPMQLPTDYSTAGGVASGSHLLTFRNVTLLLSFYVD